MRRIAAPALALALLFLTVVTTSLSTAAPQDAVVATASTAPLVAEERAAPEPRGRPVSVAVLAPTATPAPTEEPAPATPEPMAPPAAPIVVAVQAAAAAACPASFFCYPRLGIAAPIVPYDDCSGRTDVGSAIRQLLCVRRGIWLAGHAYTVFGRITGFDVGDVVFVRGQRFEITGSSVQQACVPSTVPIAPLSLQTSLDSTACGRVLVVQGR